MTVAPATKQRLRRVRDVLTPDRLRTIVAFVAAIAVFGIGDILHPGFASAESVKAILLTASFVGFVAAGQTFVVLVGGIDLSVPWVLNAGAILVVTTHDLEAIEPLASRAVVLASGRLTPIAATGGLRESYRRAMSAS